MELKVYLFLIQAILSVFALTLIKIGIDSSLDLRSKSTAQIGILSIGVLSYVLSFVLWIVILNRFELGTSYPIAVSLSILLTILSSTIFLGEKFTAANFAGVVLIVSGIFVLVSDR